MTWQSHRWFRVGWYRSISQNVPYASWQKRVNRLGRSGTRAREMNIQHNRLDTFGGLEEPYRNKGEGI